MLWVAAIGFLSPQVQADIVYNYTGNDLTDHIFTLSQGVISGGPDYGAITASADFNIPQNYTGNAAAVSITLNYENQSFNFIGNGNFQFVNGSIVYWNAGGYYYSTGFLSSTVPFLNISTQNSIYQIFSGGINAFDQAVSIGIPNVVPPQPNNTCGYSCDNFNNPGVWNISGGQSVSACQIDLTNALQAQAIGANIIAVFAPSGGIAKAASDCGVAKFDWTQSINFPTPFPSVFTSLGMLPSSGTSDPPVGGWDYQTKNGCQNTYPFYYALNASSGQACGLALIDHTTATALKFSDAPSDPCLPLTANATPAQITSHATNLALYCGGQNANANAESFTTTLVGITSGGTIVNLPITDYFSWGTTFNGTTGGAFQQNTNDLPDVGSGTGGAFIVSVDGVPVPEPASNIIFVSYIIIMIGFRWYYSQKRSYEH